MSKVRNRKLGQMNCDNIKNLSLEYFGSNIDSEQRTNIENHLQNCKSCSQFYLFSKINYLEIEKSKRTENDPYFYSALMAKIENQNSRSTILSRNPSFRISLVAIIMVISIFGGLLIGSYSAEILNANLTTVNETITTEDQLGFDLANNELDIFTDLNNNNNE